MTGSVLTSNDATQAVGAAAVCQSRSGLDGASLRRAPLRRALAGCAMASALLLAACSPQIITHGHLFQEGDLQRVQPGMSADEVQGILGTPATTATVGTGNAFYYISSKTKQVAFLAEQEVDRRVLAVYFTRTNTVERVADYGMKDGRVFDFISRTTPASGGNEDGLFKSLFRNLGKGAVFGD